METVPVTQTEFLGKFDGEKDAKAELERSVAFVQLVPIHDDNGAAMDDDDDDDGGGRGGPCK